MNGPNKPAKDDLLAAAPTERWQQQLVDAMNVSDGKISLEIENGKLDARTALAVLSYLRYRLALAFPGMDDRLSIPATEFAAKQSTAKERPKAAPADLSGSALLPFKIEQLWAFLAQDKDQQEGVVAVQVGGTLMPLVAADVERLEQLRPLALQTALQTNMRVVIARFDHRFEDDVIDPILPGGPR